MKKIQKIFLSILLLAFSFSFVPSLSTFAEDPDNVNNQNNQTSSDCRYVLGFVSWDCGTNFTNGTTPTQEQLISGAVAIAVNVSIDITVLAAYLVLGYTIYGGYLYIFSGGDPGKVATGKKALYHAFLGLAIVMSANLIMNTIRFALLGANGGFNCDLLSNEGTNCVDPNSAITGAIQWFVGIAGVVAAIFVVYGGVSYITSSGDPSKLQKAKQMIIYALIGLAIVALAEVITAFVSNVIKEADKSASLYPNNEIIIPKELHEKIT